MVRFYDPVDLKDLAYVENKLVMAGIKYVVTGAVQGSVLPGTITIAEEDLPYAEDMLKNLAAQTKH